MKTKSFIILFAMAVVGIQPVVAVNFLRDFSEEPATGAGETTEVYVSPYQKQAPLTVVEVVTNTLAQPVTEEVVSLSCSSTVVTSVEENVKGLITNRAEKATEVPMVVERPVTNVVEKVVEKPVMVEKWLTNVVEKVVEKEVVVERPVTNVVEKVVEKPVVVEKWLTNVVEKVVEKEVERPVTNVVEKVVEKPVVVEKWLTNVVEKVVEKEVEVERPVTNVVEKVVTNIVEKVVRDEQHEAALLQEKTDLEAKHGLLEAKNLDLKEQNERLMKALEAEKAKNVRLERAVPKEARKALLTGRMAKITSMTTTYDRKEGIVYFNGQVHVDDEQYQLHADKAYVFMSGTNELHRIVALGNIAMTNEARRAYGTKLSYYKDNGMVVLSGNASRPAEVRDESRPDDQTVVGSKIKFWIDSEQVEVLDAIIQTPVNGGFQEMKSAIGR